ncbi:MAG TPA: M1 family metallopeptidase [Cyclobacteriaceae bacterium]|nr:M1 family metallopeptidase [Cyclobacteriaceae bacterium]
MKKSLTITLLTLILFTAYAQPPTKRAYTRADTIRGAVTKERGWWDLQKYELTVAVNPEAKMLKGSNIVRYKVVSSNSVMQIDLQAPMVIESVSQDGKKLEVTDVGNAHFIKLVKPQNVGDVNDLKIEFSGNPRVAVRAPWDGGITWGKDSLGNHFVATSNQGIGASVWWPCKDHPADEPDNGILISLNVPGNLVAVANGRLKKEIKEKNKTKTFVWEVISPINDYGVNINVGDYVHFSEKYNGEKGVLDMDYWVLRYNLEKAKAQFKDAPRMMKAFEHWFGPYPFYEDSYKLVEVPYLGMEHQSSVTYGNKYKNGYLGRDLSGTGWGLKWDYIIIHESGHEWFANNITYKDVADMWVHEGFTMYSESLFIEYYYGKEAGQEYTRGLRITIGNQSPVIGDYDVHGRGAQDMYNKGNNILNTLRTIVNNDDLWRTMLRGLGKTFYHQTVTSKQIEEYIAKTLNLNLNAFFDQYLRNSQIPAFEYWINDGKLIYRWANCIPGFDMPITLLIDGKPKVLNPTRMPKTEKLDSANPSVKVDPNFYVYSFNLMGN